MDIESTPLDLSVTSRRKRRNQLPPNNSDEGKTSSFLPAGCQTPNSRLAPETSKVNQGATRHPGLVDETVPKRQFGSLVLSSSPRSVVTDSEPAAAKDMPNGPVRKCRKRPNLYDMVCRVCGDRAFGYNFDVISCESCKAFFRRNALKAQPLECDTQGECQINIFTRRFCPACRLQKCFAMGMNPDLILENTRQKARAESLAQQVPGGKRDARSQQLQPHPHHQHLAKLQNGIFGVANARDDSFSALQANVVPSHTGLMVCPRTALSIPDVQQQLPAPFNNRHFSTLARHQLLQTPHAHLVLPGLFPQACPQDLFHHVPSELLPSDPHMYWRVSAEEATLLTHLTSAYQDTLMTTTSPERVAVDAVRQKRRGPCGLEVVAGVVAGAGVVDDAFSGGSFEKNVEQLFSFASKLVDDFGQFPSEDRVTLLRASILPTTLLRWTACSEGDVRLPRSGENESDTDTAAGFSFGEDSVMRGVVRFCRSLKSLLKNDLVLFALLHCLVLFEARVPDLVDRQAVSAASDKYALLLKHYVESEYSFLHAGYYLTALRNRLAELRCLGGRTVMGLCGSV